MESKDFYQVFSWGSPEATFDSEENALKYAEILRNADDDNINKVTVKPLKYMAAVPTMRKYWTVWVGDPEAPEFFREEQLFTDEDFAEFLKASTRFLTRKEAEAATPALAEKTRAANAVREWARQEADKVYAERNRQLEALES